MTEAIHPMGVVVERTGLSPHVIRAWERRHRAVIAQRTEGNRRLFTQDDIDRLLLLRRGVDAGYSIAQIARLSLQELGEIVEPGSAQKISSREVGGTRDVAEYLHRGLDAIHKLDGARLQDLLGQVEVDQGRYLMVTILIPQLLTELGELWRRGEIRTYQAHLAAAVIRNLLGGAVSGLRGGPSQGVVLTTPVGAFHELGALMAATASQLVGWRAVYLGSSLPAAEIAAAATHARALAVGLSLVYPAGDPEIVAELRKLRELLPSHTALFIGGRAAPSYKQVDLDNIQFVPNLDALQQELERLAG